MVAPASFTRRAMRMRFSPSTEQGPAMTWKWPPPSSTPCPQSTTVSAGWNLRFAFLKGSETRCTRSTMSMDSSRNGSILVVSPTRPMMVSFSPWLTWVCRPFLWIQAIRCSSASGAAFFFRIAIICAVLRADSFYKSLISLLHRDGGREVARGTTRGRHMRRGCAGAEQNHAILYRFIAARKKAGRYVIGFRWAHRVSLTLTRV